MSIPGRGRVGAPGSGGDRASGLGDSQRLNLPGSSVLRITTFTSWHWPFFLGKRGRRGGSRETPELPPAHGILQDPLSAAPHSTLPRTLPPPRLGAVPFTSTANWGGQRPLSHTVPWAGDEGPLDRARRHSQEGEGGLQVATVQDIQRNGGTPPSASSP